MTAKSTKNRLCDMIVTLNNNISIWSNAINMYMKQYFYVYEWYFIKYIINLPFVSEFLKKDEKYNLCLIDLHIYVSFYLYIKCKTMSHIMMEH